MTDPILMAISFVSIHAPTKGATVNWRAATKKSLVSIHAPTKGATQSLGELQPGTYVSIHAPTKGATQADTCSSLSFLFQSTLPRRERLISPRGLRTHRGFNPRSHEGSDTGSQGFLSSTSCFNPRSHEGSDVVLSFYQSFPKVSIHAPTKGATSLPLLSPPYNILFQSTLPRRERPRFACSVSFNFCFNPRSHEGSDSYERAEQYYPRVSIHAPTKGATINGNAWWNDGSTVSIHAPTKGATWHSFDASICIAVSIHAPTKGATSWLSDFNDAMEFQSTLPRRERLIIHFELLMLCVVSIHAPTKGATAISAKNSFQFSAIINKLLFSITNFPLFHPFFFTFLLHLCIFYSANLPTFSCPPPIRTLILSQNQCVIHCNSSIDTHMLHFGLILIPQIIESQTVNTFIDNICQNCLQSNTLGIIQNTFKYRILNSSPIICALFCNFPQPLSSRSSLSIHIICDQYKHSPTSLPQEYRISVQITS